MYICLFGPEAEFFDGTWRPGGSHVTHTGHIAGRASPAQMIEVLSSRFDMVRGESECIPVNIHVMDYDVTFGVHMDHVVLNRRPKPLEKVDATISLTKAELSCS